MCTESYQVPFIPTGKKSHKYGEGENCNEPLTVELVMYLRLMLITLVQTLVPA